MTSKRMKRMAVGFLLVLMSAGVGWIYQPDAAAAEKEFVWACIDDFSGPFASSGDEAHKATVMYLEERGYKMGSYKVKIITRDTELKPATAVRRLQEVIEAEKPVIVSSSCSSAVQLAMCDIIGKTKGPIFWTQGWDTGLTGLQGNRYTFRWATPLNAQSQVAFRAYLKKFPEIKKVILCASDYASGYDWVKQSEVLFEEMKIKNIKSQYVPLTATDASVFVTEAKGSGADAYCIGTYGKVLGILLKQAHEFGLKKTMKIFSNTGTLNMLRGLDPSIIEGMYFADHWNHVIPNEWSKRFTEKYKKKYGVIPSDSAAEKYMECELTERVITQTGSIDPKVLIPALEKLGEYEGPCGKEHMAAWQHQIVHPFLLLRGKAPNEKKYADDFVEVIGSAIWAPKQGDKGFEFDRTKEAL